MKTGLKIVALVALIAVTISIFLFVYSYARTYSAIETYDKREKLPLKGDPKILVSSGNRVDDYKRMVANNFVLLGISDYNAGEIGSKAALTMATLIGAQVVIIDQEYADVDTEQIPAPVQSQTQTANSGPINASGQDPTPRDDSDMSEPAGLSFIPEEISSTDYGAQFWARARQPVFGANFSNFNPADTNAAGTEEGVKIYVLIQNSPAHSGNVNINDLITHVDGKSVRGVEDFMNIIEHNAGNEIILSVVRKEEKLILPIKLNDIQ